MARPAKLGGGGAATPRARGAGREWGSVSFADAVVGVAGRRPRQHLGADSACGDRRALSPGATAPPSTRSATSSGVLGRRARRSAPACAASAS